MIQATDSLQTVFDGWQGYNQSLVSAIQPLTAAQLTWRPAENLQSVGEVARHISLGRIDWFVRMDAPGSAALADSITAWETDSDGNRDIIAEQVVGADETGPLVEWLEKSWGMIEQTLNAWTIAELDTTYRHVWNGDAYANSRQWTLYRILSHDLHHGGEISLMLGMQGIEAFELSGLFGHIILPPQADP